MTNKYLPNRKVSESVEGLWPELQQRETEELIGVPIGVEAYRTLENARWTGPYAIIKCIDGETGEHFTFGCSGKVIVRHLIEADSKGMLPFAAALIQRPASPNPYWVLVDPDSDEALRVRETLVKKGASKSA